MAEERKGVMTPKQEKQLDDICEFDGWMETFDGPAIRIADNQIIERLKTRFLKNIIMIFMG